MSLAEATSARAHSAGPQPTHEQDFVLVGAFQLECGRVLRDAVLHYSIYGQLNAAGTNAVLACHALSGSSLVGEWWPGLFQTEQQQGIVDLAHQCVICVNLIGSCYGSTGPASIDPEAGLTYGPNFPLISIRDNVHAQARLLDSLGIHTLRLVIGGSIGGMNALEWSILYPQRVRRAVIIAVSPLPAMGLALNHLQRSAIQNDPQWMHGLYPPDQQPRQGLALARQIGMLSYKSAQLFTERFGRNPNRNGEDPWALDQGPHQEGGGLTGGRFDIAGFLDYQGERFLERFDANTYLAILRTMDTWEPTSGFRSAQEAFRRIQAELIFVGITSDWLFPASDVRELAAVVAAAGPRAVYREMVTDHGHDAFLAEQTALVRLLRLID